MNRKPNADYREEEHVTVLVEQFIGTLVYVLNSHVPSSREEAFSEMCEHLETFIHSDEEQVRWHALLDHVLQYEEFEDD